MFRVKICGVTRVADAAAVAEAGGDAIGLNFYAKSPRWVDDATADAIVAAIGERLTKVGVFVNSPREVVLTTYERLQLDFVQLHGDESPEYLQELGANVPVIRAFRCGEEGLAPVAGYLAACQRLGCSPKMVLIDAHRAGEYGGTGAVAPWQVVAGFRELGFAGPLILAGGLTPENVAAAITAVGPAAVDTASGVESRPGVKDKSRIRRFVAAAKKAFQISAAG